MLMPSYEPLHPRHVFRISLLLFLLWIWTKRVYLTIPFIVNAFLGFATCKKASGGGEERSNVSRFVKLRGGEAHKWLSGARITRGCHLYAVDTSLSLYRVHRFRFNPPPLWLIFWHESIITRDDMIICEGRIEKEKLINL